MEKLIQKIKELLAMVSQLKVDLLYKYAYEAIGTDVSPKDYAPDDLGCAESVSEIIKRVIPTFPILISTYSLWLYFRNSPLFKEIQQPKKGCIVLSVTGTGNGRILNGHTGIVGKNLSPDGSFWVMSNDSRSGLWSVNFTINAWNRYYQDRGGMKTRFFEIV